MFPTSSALPPILSGTIPGLLDPSQPARLLSSPASQLHFASFNPRTASPDLDSLNLRSLSLNEELYRPKRVVIEITPEGSFWRFVPRARREETVQDEGIWPKLVDICGQVVNCSRDQWDIYMLDPAYTCFIRSAPHLPIITRAEASKNDPPRSPAPSSKRRPSSPSPSLDRQPPGTSSSTKKPRATTYLSSDDESEVEDMIANDDSRPRATSAGPSLYHRERSKIRAETEQKRKARREKMKLSRKYGLDDVLEDHVMTDLNPREIPSTPNTSSQPLPRPSATKRKEHRDHFRTASDSESAEDVAHPTGKRARTSSPLLTKREPPGKRTERGKQRAKEKKQKQEQLRQARQEAFEQEIYASFLGQQTHVNGTTDQKQDLQTDSDEVDEIDPEELARQRIEESRRKIAEIEKDRPVWEEEAKKRRAREQMEEREMKAAKQARERKAEAERWEKERREREARARAEREKVEREEAIRREREKKRAQHRSRWARGPWSIQRALERYKFLCDQFDSAKYCPSEPLTFEDVPWPILPMSFSVEDIAWSAVEHFFESVKPHMRLQDYKVFVEKSHRRFHPDRWRARGLLKSMQDDDERECLEVAANTVAQALTPLWRQVKQ